MLNLNIALVQADIVWKDPKSNFILYEKLIESNKKQTDLIVLPEMFATGFVTEPQEVAETMEGQTVLWMQTMAKKNQCVLTGSAVIVENGCYYNRLLWVDRHGTIQTYDKKHLFTYAGEHLKFTAGTRKLKIEINGWKIQPLICYDLRFPVWAKNTYHDQVYGYDVLLYIANWPAARSHPFRQLLVARAIENQAYVLGVNRVGLDGNSLYYQGDTTAIDFNGKHLLEINPDTEALVHISLSYEDLRKARESFPVGADWDVFTVNN